jgi:nucleotide-binding universal stress UspA family protein
MLTTSINRLVPLDGTAESNVALPLARTLARQTGGSITLLQVVADPFTLSERIVFDKATDALTQVAHELSAGGIHVEVVVRRGEVVHELLQQSRIQAANLIVMRTHGRAGLERAVLGSTTQRVLSESGLPVLVL